MAALAEVDALSSEIVVQRSVSVRLIAPHISRVRSEGSQKAIMHHNMRHETPNEMPATVACVATSVLRSVKARMLIKKESILHASIITCHQETWLDRYSRPYEKCVREAVQDSERLVMENACFELIHEAHLEVGVISHEPATQLNSHTASATSSWFLVRWLRISNNPTTMLPTLHTIET